MKVLLKKEVCGFREQYMRPTGKATSHRNALQKKKKKQKQNKTKNVDADANNHYPNGHLI